MKVLCQRDLKLLMPLIVAEIRETIIKYLHYHEQHPGIINHFQKYAGLTVQSLHQQNTHTKLVGKKIICIFSGLKGKVLSNDKTIGKFEGYGVVPQ